MKFKDAQILLDQDVLADINSDVSLRWFHYKFHLAQAIDMNSVSRSLMSFDHKQSGRAR